MAMQLAPLRRRSGKIGDVLQGDGILAVLEREARSATAGGEAGLEARGGGGTERKRKGDEGVLHGG